MEITVIHGQGHKGSTYHITYMVKERLTDWRHVQHYADAKTSIVEEILARAYNADSK
ncbi:MAG: hypothetical protein GX494_05980 [Clostridiaceae bacterium]|nr:hypothetical protein [Clostridiaceae bacterium]